MEPRRPNRTTESGYREHFIRRGSAHGEWETVTAQYRILSEGKKAHLFPYGIHLMDNDELILLAGLYDSAQSYSCVAYFSGDSGNTWSAAVDAQIYGSILTAYGNYLSRGCALILWRPA